MLVQTAWGAVRSKDGGALRDKYKYMSQTKGIAKGKSIVKTARKLGELLYMLLKTKTEYKPQKFITPEFKISKLTEEALAVNT